MSEPAATPNNLEAGTNSPQPSPNPASRNSPNATNPASTNQRTAQQTIAIRRRRLRNIWNTTDITTSVCRLIVRVIFLALYGRRECDSPLHIYIIGLAVLDVLYAIPAKPLQMYIERHPEHNDHSLVFTLRKLWGTFQALDFVWFVVANIWTFRSQTCKDTNPHLYWLAFTEIMLKYATVVLPFTAFLLLLCIFRDRLRNRGPMQALADLPTGLTELELTRLKTFSYHEAQSQQIGGLPPAKPLPDREPTDEHKVDIIPPTTNPPTNLSSHTCSICITDYVPSDRLRELACGHRFHKSCVDQWLVGDPDSNNPGHRTCPLCVQEAVKAQDRDPDYVKKKKLADDGERAIQGDMQRALALSRREAERATPSQERGNDSEEGPSTANSTEQQ